MRFIYCAIAGGIISGGLHFDIWFGVVIGLGVAIVITPRPGTHRVIVENVQTGEVRIQPNDVATQRYLSTRKDSNN